MRDEDLREQLAAWVRPVERLPVPDITVLRRRARRRRMRRAATGAAAFAVVAVAAGVIVVNLPQGRPSGAPASSARPTTTPGPTTRPSATPTSSPPPSTTPGPTRSTWYPAGPAPAPGAAPEVAPYVVTLAFQRDTEPAVVTDAFTGKVIATVHPVPGTSLTGVAAAGDDRTFVLAAQDSNGAGTQFYELRLGPGGQPRPLALLAVPAMSSYGGAFAVSADGSRLAVAGGTGQIDVVSLPTGAVRSWTAPGGRVSDLSWAGDRTLAFEWSDSSPSAAAAQAGSGVRVLDTETPGSDLLASRFIIPESDSTSVGDFSELAYPLISPDGSKVFATMVSGEPANPAAEVVEFSARTGQALAVVTPPADESGMGEWCGVLWTDPSGVQVTAVCGVEGQTGDGHFTQLNLHVPVYSFSTPRDSFIAW
jgi:hypothetical protein